MILGKLTHPRSIGAKGLVQNIHGARQIDTNATVVEVPGKHRYIMPLDDAMRKQIEPLAKPYPKREKQAMASFPEAQRRGSTDLHAPEFSECHSNAS